MIWHKRVFYSQLPPSAFMEKLRLSIDDVGLGYRGYKGAKPVAGWIQTDQFKLRRVKSLTNFMEPIVRGVVLQREAGSQITCEVGPSKFAVAFVAVWVSGFIAVFFGSGMANGTVSLRHLLHFSGLLAFMFSLVGYCIYESRNDVPEMISVVEKAAGSGKARSG
jgi:hypothetical protein